MKYVLCLLILWSLDLQVNERERNNIFKKLYASFKNGGLANMNWLYLHTIYLLIWEKIPLIYWSGLSFKMNYVFEWLDLSVDAL